MRMLLIFQVESMRTLPFGFAVFPGWHPRRRRIHPCGADGPESALTARFPSFVDGKVPAPAARGSLLAINSARGMRVAQQRAAVLGHGRKKPPKGRSGEGFARCEWTSRRP